MTIRNVLITLSVFALASLTACGGSGNSASTPSAMSTGTTSQTASRTYPMSSSAASYDLPPVGGFSGSVALPAAPIPANASLRLTSSLQAPPGAPNILGTRRRPQSTGTLNVYFYTTIQLSTTVTFSTLPGFSITLPSTIDTTNQQFFYAISDPTQTDAVLHFRTEGPGTVSGQTLTFAPSSTPLTLQAGLPYVVAFFAVSPVVKPSTQKIYVTNRSPIVSVTVYNAASNGNVPPIATISGSNTGLTNPTGIAVDSVGQIYVAVQGSILVFAANANGNVSPVATISGPNTGIGSLEGLVLDATGRIYAANNGSGNPPGGVLVFEGGANGNVAPIATIGGTHPGILLAWGIAVDNVGRIYVANSAIFHHGEIDVFASGANGDVAPIAIINTSTTLGVALDTAGKVYISHSAAIGVPGSVEIVGSAADNFAPVGTIFGPDTRLSTATGVAVDGAGQIYVTTSDSVNVFAAGANRDVAPTAIIRGSNTGLGPGYVTVR
jgi:hypothetical protein